MKYLGRTDEYFEITDLDDASTILNNNTVKGLLTVIWFEDDNNRLTIDAQQYTFAKDEIITLTGFHKISIQSIGKTKVLRFNKPFYCILDHDSEVSCKGILFYGSARLPLLKPTEDELDRLKSVWKMATDEMTASDGLQLEMLQMMLKRLLILFTRIYKRQDNFEAIATGEVDIVREYHYLVEQHFRKYHLVTDYAQLLNKSPKTLSNLFGKTHNRTPLQLIQDRIMLEARRIIRYTDQPVSEIGYDLGFRDVQSFSRFFKKHEGISPSKFKEA